MYNKLFEPYKLEISLHIYLYIHVDIDSLEQRNTGIYLQGFSFYRLYFYTFLLLMEILCQFFHEIISYQLSKNNNNQ
jgi:hypothetical protein